MSTRTSPRRRDEVEQLALFRPRVPDRFIIDDETRRRGMRHVARLKAELAARYPARTSRSRATGHAA